MKKAIVIGGTGVVGREVIRELAAAEHIGAVLSLTRRAVTYDSPKVVNQVIDFADLSSHRDLFSGDMLFSCLGTTLKQAGSVAAQRRVDLDYQFDCAALAAEQGVAHYFLVSSSGANRRSLLAYPRMKGQLEHQVKQLPFKSITILQPSLLLGERTDKRLGEEIAAAILPTICKLPGLQKMRPISGTQVARKMVSISKSPSDGVSTFSLDELFS